MLMHGDLFDVLPTLDAESIDSGVTDPPYGIGFMGRKWDTFTPEAGESRIVPNRQIASDNPNLKGRTRGPASSPSAVEYNRSLEGQRGFQDWTARWATEVFRVLKPGAHLVVCGAPRSHHRMMCGLEDAGFEIRDTLSFLFGQGFPKSLNFGCKCREKPLPCSHHSKAESERDVRPLFDADVSTTVHVEEEPGEVLLDGLSQHRVSVQGTAGTEAGDARGEQPGVERRQLHRAGEGLPSNSDAGASASAGERLRVGAHPRGGDDPGPPAEAERGSASQGSGPREQRTGQSAYLRLPSRTLDGGAPERSTRCERCGGLTEARGQGTGLKPGWEPVVLARKPFKGTYADNFIKYGVGGLNVDGCRIDGEPWSRQLAGNVNESVVTDFRLKGIDKQSHDLGRWPANVLLDDEAAVMLDAQSGELASGDYTGERSSDKTRAIFGAFAGTGPRVEGGHVGDTGGASRFFYVAKPSREERDLGCEHLETRQRDDSRKEGNPGGDNPRNRGLQQRGNFHPTVKPVELMRWLVRLVTPPGGAVLDPFAGSGTTGMACRYELREFIGIEREAEYVAIAERRIAACVPLFADVRPSSASEACKA